MLVQIVLGWTAGVRGRERKLGVHQVRLRSRGDQGWARQRAGRAGPSLLKNAKMFYQIMNMKRSPSTT